MSPKTLLYAEDEPDDVLLLQFALKKAQLPVQLVTASDGQEVMDYLSRSGQFADTTRFPWPSLLLLDIHLPRKSGLEVLQWVRQNRGLDTLVVLMFTSSELDLDVHSACRFHANGYLVKPSAPAKLVDLCKSLHQFWLDFNFLPPNVARPADVPKSFITPFA